MREVMLPDTLYILGTGTTTKAIAHHISVPKTLLSIDANQNRVLVTADTDEALLHLARGRKMHLVLSLSNIFFFFFFYV